MAIKFYGGHQLNSKAKVYGSRQDFEVIEVDENGDPITEPSYMPENTNNGSTNWNTIGSNLSDTRSATELTWNIDNSIAPLTAYGTDGWMFQKVSEPSIQLESSYVVSLKVLNATSDLTVRVVKGNTEYGFTPSMVDSLAEQTIPAGDYTNSPQSVSMVVDIGATLGTWNNTLMIQFASAAGYGTFSIQDVLLTDGAQVAPASYYKTLATQYVPPPPMTVGWSNAGLSESERVAPASNGMQLYRHDQPYTNAHSNRTLHNLPEYLEGLPFSVESASPSPENGIQGTTNAFEEYTFNTSGTLYLILRADWGGYIPSTLELQLSDNNIGSTGVSDPSAWTFVEDNVGYMGGGGDYGTLVFSKSVESGTHSLNNLYHYAFKADPAPEFAPAPTAFQLWRLYASESPSFAWNGGYLWDIQGASGIRLGDNTELASSETTGGLMSATYGQIPVAGEYGIYTSNASNPFTETTYNGGWDAGPGNMFNGERTSWSSQVGHWILWYLHQPIELTAMEGGEVNMRTYVGNRPDRCPRETLLQYYTGDLNSTYDASKWVTFSTLKSNQYDGNPTWTNITQGSIKTV